jgi:Leucine-rich repeat (LRR) protein
MGDWDYAVEHGFEDSNGDGNAQIHDYYNDEDSHEKEGKSSVKSISVQLTPSNYLDSKSRYMRANLVNHRLDSMQVVLEVLHDRFNEQDSLALEVYCNQHFIGYIQKKYSEVNIEEFCFSGGEVLRDLILDWKDNHFELTCKKSTSNDSIKPISLAPYERRSIQHLWEWADYHDISEIEFPRNHDDLIELTELRINQEDLLYIPPEIGCLQNLVTLIISSNSIRRIPVSIGMLRELNKLEISGDKIRNLPSEIGNLEKLTILSFSGNSLTSIPTELNNLSKLTHLSFSGNSLPSIPTKLNNLSKLTHLDIDVNKLDPTVNFSWLTELNELEVLRLNINELTSIPGEVFDLNKLKRLSICETKIEEIPEAIGSLSNLIELNISDNRELKSLPDSIDGLINLVRLTAFSTPLETLPESIINLTNVRFLRFSREVELPDCYREWEDKYGISMMRTHV